jgi:putative Holliday junction resolvase
MTDMERNVAFPAGFVNHQDYTTDARLIIEKAVMNDCDGIVFGIALDPDNQETPSSRKTRRLADRVKQLHPLVIYFQDEFGTTLAAREAVLELDVSRRKRKGHHDSIAATIILQRFLENH